MRRLYLQVYLAILGVLFLFGVLVAMVWLGVPTADSERQVFDDVGAIAAEVLPPGLPAAELERRLRVASPLGVKATLWSAEGTVLGSSGEPLPFPGRRRSGGGWMHVRGGPVGVLRFPDGRWLVVRHPRHTAGQGLGVLAALVLLAVAVAAGAYPLARRLTRRLERLRSAVEELGQGDFQARVPVEGKDEVASLARSFNAAALRIEKLVGAQRLLLLGASHELRSPLARLRVAFELLGPDRPELRERAERDIAELDGLIDELLLASRLETAPLDKPEDVDLLALLAEEAARTEAEVSGRPVTVRGDARLLRRLARNLLENARRHGAGSPVVAWAGPGDDGRARLTVCDRGPGVPESERERIFAPFYRPPGAAADGGVGLGLALVRQIARHHGGDASCQAREGGGTCFSVDLPR